MVISTTPSEQSIRGLQQQSLAIWTAVEQACEREDFRPRPGRLCDFCAYHQFCPAMGGDLSKLPSPVADLREASSREGAVVLDSGPAAEGVSAVSILA